MTGGPGSPGTGRRSPVAAAARYEVRKAYLDRSAVDLLPGEPGRSGVALEDGRQVVAADHVGEPAEAVGGELLDDVDDPLRAAGAVHPHDLRGLRKPVLLVGRQRGGNVGVR